MPRNLNAPETTPNNGPVFSSSSTPRASIYRYNTSYVASPDGTNAPSTPTSTARPTQLRPTTPYMGATLTQRPLLSRPATPPTVQSPNKSHLPSSPLSRPLASIDEEEEEEEIEAQHRPGVVEYVLHTGSCFAKTLMTVAYGIALMDVKCLAAGRNLFNSISNNYKVDKLLFALTCAAILFSLSFVLSTTTSTPKYSPILSTVDLESQITEAINNRMQIIQNQLRTGASRHDDLEAAYQRLSNYINEQLAGKFALQDKILADKAAEVAAAYLRSLEDKNSAMGETVKLELQAFINEQLAGKFALQDKILSDKASEVATAYLRTLEEKTAAMGETLKNELQNYIKSSLEAAIPPAPPASAPSLPPAPAPTPASSYDEKGSGWDEARIVRVVEDAMERFAADRIGKPDFALRTAGASIIESRTSESYGQTWWSNLPVPFARRIITQPPTVILEPDVTVGRCWAFAGNQGRVTIELSEPVIPTSFTLDHISPSIAHVRGLASAPKVFAVYGLQNATDSGLKLGTYSYDTTINRASQSFPAQVKSTAFPLISLEVLSNYGHHYTCLYRFRVHSDV